MELWWFWDTGGQLPYLAYILITGYFVTFVLSAILVRGISHKQIPPLILWLFGIVAILIPEGGLVLFMSFQFWKIYTIYGLTEITCWACRLLVNVAGLICVYFLYLNWKEEKQVLTSLRDLNLASRAAVVENGRRASVSSDSKLPQVAYSNPGFNGIQDHPPTFPPPHPHLRRAGSMVSIGSRKQIILNRPICNEFNASLFDSEMRSSFKSRSMYNLHSPVPIQQTQQISNHSTNSLDRSLRRYRSLGFFPSGGDDRMRNGYFTVAPSGFVVNEMGKVAFVQEPVIGSRVSIESDDLQKYRDVAL